MTLVLRGATLIDGTGGPPAPNAHVVIEEDTIAAVTSAARAAETPRNAQVIDLTGKWLLPGLIDLHIHSYSYDDPPRRRLETEAYTALLAASQLHKHLMAGVTTVRDVGTQRKINISAARAIKAGVIPGPRMFACGQYIAQTGGHGSENPLCAREADGLADIRLAVREQWKAGADFIKVMLNGYPDVLEFTLEELEALVDESHRLAMKVACHASILSAARNAVEAGVDTIEHGCQFDEDVVATMADKGIVMVPTRKVFVGMVERREELHLRPEAVRILEKRASTHQEAIRLALRAKVKIGAGTDWSVISVPDELVSMVEAGVSPMQAIQAATRVGAETLGIADRVGTAQAGKIADLIVAERDPLKDIGALCDVSTVIQSGKIVKCPPASRSV